MDIPQTIPRANAVEVLLARSTVYRALSVLLRHPTTWLSAAGWPSGVGVASASQPLGGLPAAGTARWWNHPDANTAKWLVAREHHRLPEVLGRLGADGRMSELAHRLLQILEKATIPDLTRQHELTFGHAVQGAAPPYELEYGEEHSHRQPQELSDIAAFYTAFGLRIAPSSHERVDHIGTECEFLHYLLYKRACALDEDAEEQAQVCEAATRQFLADHLGRWGPAFALRLTRVAGDPSTRPARLASPSEAAGLAQGRPERVPSLPRDESKDDGWLGIVGALLLEWLSQECTRMDIPLGSCDLPLRSPKEQDEVGCAACVLQQGKPGDGC